MNRTRPACGLLAAGMLAALGCARDVTVEEVAGTTPSDPFTSSAPADSGPAELDASEPVAPEDDQPAPQTVETDGTTPTETTAPAEAVVGAPAPDFVATGLDGEQVSLSDYLGEQNVVVAFSRAHW